MAWPLPGFDPLVVGVGPIPSRVVCSPADYNKPFTQFVLHVSKIEQR